MIEILAAAAETAVQSPSALQTYGPAGAILIALGGWKGIAQGILWLQNRSSNGNGIAVKYVPQTECDLRHDKNAQQAANLVKSMDRLEQAVTTLSGRIDHVLDARKE